MDSYVIVLAPSGVGLSNSVNKLKANIRASLESNTEGVKSVDIEYTLQKRAETRHALDEVHAPLRNPPEISMYDVTWNLPRSRIATLWEVAVKQALNELYESRASVKILSGNMIYYGGQRDESYSVFNPHLLLEESLKLSLKPSHVLLLIDDVYDMYSRLKEKDELYHPESRLPGYFGQIQNEENIVIRELPKKYVALLCLGWEVAVLTHLLAWRHHEAILAENLALQLDSKFLVWGVKQLTKAAACWITEPDQISVYLSHPVTQPRRILQAEGQWPQFVWQVNKLQKQLLENGIVCVMPTAIDEYRFARKENQEITPSMYTGSLASRWPEPGDESKLLYSRPNKATDTNHKDILAPKCWDFSQGKLVEFKEEPEPLTGEINMSLRSFANEIKFQIASRDHLLVSHTDGLLIFRPFYKGESDFSGGVRREIEHWKDSWQSGIRTRAAFVHFVSDIQAMLESRRKDPGFGLDSELRAEMAHIAKKKYKIEEQAFFKLVSSKEARGVLGDSTISPAVQRKISQDLPNIQRQAKINLLRSYLTAMVQVDDAYLGIWIVDNGEQFAKEVSQYFKTGSPIGNKWEDRIDDIFCE